MDCGYWFLLRVPRRSFAEDIPNRTLVDLGGLKRGGISIYLALYTIGAHSNLYTMLVVLASGA